MEQSKQEAATKYDAGKLRYDLIPARPLEELARVYTIGCKKYADRNWEKGMSWMRIVGAMMRHLWRWVRGERYDQETGQHHLSSVAWGTFALIEYEHTHPELDDRPVKDLEPSDKIQWIEPQPIGYPVSHSYITSCGIYNCAYCSLVLDSHDHQL
jgi:hypothetical protein